MSQFITSDVWLACHEKVANVEQIEAVQEK